MTNRFRVWAALLAAGVTAAHAAGYGEPTLVCRFKDRKIAESSGIASSSRSDAYFFTHNDSGDGPVVYAVRRDGETLATLRVPGAEAEDWEDMARGPDEAGASCLFLGDIGDNPGKRTRITVYRVPEPPVDDRGTGVTGTTAPAARFDFQYEDGPHDAESLLVHPTTGRLYIVTKFLNGSGVYAGPPRLASGAPNVLKKIGEIRFGALAPPRKSTIDQLSALLATGGDFAPDGTRIVVRTYLDAYEWKVRNGEVGAAVKSPPVHISLPELRGGEAIAYTRDGKGLLLTTEGENAPVHKVTYR